MATDEEEGEIISDDENNGPQDQTREEKRVPEEKKSSEPRPMSIGDIAARIQEQNALRMASGLERMPHDEDRSRKRHHKKEKRRRRNSHSEEDSPHRKHRRHERQRSRSRSKSRSRSPPKKAKKEDRVPCKYYMEGKCQKSDDCPFSHAIEQTKRTDLCRFYVSGHCIKRNCPFMHEDFPCKFYHTGAPCFADKSCRYSHAPLTDEMRDVLMRYLDECKGLKREDLERLSRKAKEREDRQKDPKAPPRSHKEPLLELPQTLRTEGMQLGVEDTDFRILPPGTADVDYRLPVGKDDGVGMQAFYRDTMESPNVSPNGRRESHDIDRSPGHGTESADSKRAEAGDRHNQSPKRVVERPADPRDRSNNVDTMPGIPKSQRDLLMRLQQRVETSQDSQGSSQEEGRRTPMPDEDTGENRHDGQQEDSDDDQPLTDVIKRLQQTPANTDAPPPPAAASRPGGGIDLVKMISSINSSSNSNNQSQSVIAQPNEYWKQLLTIAGVDPATGTSLPTATTNQTTPPKVDPRKARDPRQQAQSLPSQLPVFPTLEVTVTIESHDGEAPYVLRPIETSPVRYDELVHLVKMNFRLKSDPRLERHLEKLGKREELVVESPQSPPHIQPAPSVAANFLAQLAIGKPGLLPAPVLAAPDRSKIDPRLRLGNPSGGVDLRPPGLPMPDIQALAMGDLRRPPGMMPSMSPVSLPAPVVRQDPRQAARQDPRQESRFQPAFASPRNDPPNVTPVEPRQNSARVDPRRRADPRAKSTPATEDPPNEDQVKKPTPPIVYSSPLSAYDDQVPEKTSPYPRRNIGRIKKKNPPPAATAPQTASSSEETQKTDMPSTSSAPASTNAATPPASAAAGSAGLDSLPAMPSLRSHPVDSYSVDVEDKTLSEMFKNKDPTASPFN
ncbi:arginine-glutamic acid dipeptide repeats protein [Galendromus occidentalis]|uniref:Arginine-glutamic acid dipeptide repeats protein n=1 Tax=Galendromus occidentalis TaxID=34638 RepID=A0AAJ7L8X4_9ACAR|nr:arginine-glutamic acid dipeptide repeats protein [Galendromus occidentalis]